VTTLEIDLRLSLIRTELIKIAEQLTAVRPKAARVVRYVVNVLGLLNP
jgi:hypothetical protein